MKRFAVFVHRDIFSTRGIFVLLLAGMSLMAVLGLGPLIVNYIDGGGDWQSRETLLTLAQFALVGFVAQLIDGALGMAYGVSANSFLMSFGAPPSAASAAVHVAKVFTSGASGLSHLQMGNVNRRLALALTVPGILGALAGAYLLTHVDGNAIRPYISAYLGVMGVVILRKALRKAPASKNGRIPPGLLAVIGGCLDAIGGGGWGPVVTASLLGKDGKKPRTTIGSVNLAEFFVALASTSMLTLFTGVQAYALIITGLVIGGVLAAPLAAWVCRYIPARGLMALVAVVILCLSLRNFWLMWA